MTIRSSCAQTCERARSLEEAFPILPGAPFFCGRFNECENSVQPGGKLHKGQSHYVGDHYDLSVNGRPVRIMIVGMSYGEASSLVSMEQRGRVIRSIGPGYQPRHSGLGLPARNLHMSGTTHLLRLFWGLDFDYGAQPSELVEIEGRKVHILDTFAMVNYLLCSAVYGGCRRDKATPKMKENDSIHFLKALEILDPTHILIEGTATSRSLLELSPESSGGLSLHNPHNEKVWIEHPEENQFGRTVMAMPHPSTGGEWMWGNSPDHAFLINEIKPKVLEARGRLFQ